MTTASSAGNDQSREQAPVAVTTDAPEAVVTAQAPDDVTADISDPVPPPPDDLIAWWDEIDDELASLPAAPELEESPLHSTTFATTYRVRLTSIGPYRIAAWLSIPKGTGPLPALMLAPAYGSVVTPAHYDDRARYVTLALMHRGTRHADRPYAARFPGLLTDGIDDPHTWRFRGIFADALRAFEFLHDRPEVDRQRIGIMGSDAGLMIAARRPDVAAVAVGGPFFHRLANLYPRTEAYPFEEINDHLRAHPGHRDAVDRTLSYVEPIHQAGSIAASAHISVGDPGQVGGPEWLEPLIQRIGGPVERYDVTHEGQTDRDAVDRWLARQLGVEPRPRIWNPEERGPWP